MGDPRQPTELLGAGGVYWPATLPCDLPQGSCGQAVIAGDDNVLRVTSTAACEHERAAAVAAQGVDNGSTGMPPHLERQQGSNMSCFSVATTPRTRL